MLRLFVFTFLLAAFIPAAKSQQLLSYYEIKHGQAKPEPKKLTEEEMPDFKGIKGAYDLRVRTNSADGRATISLRLDNDGYPTLEIYDMYGAKLSTLNSALLVSGVHQFEYNPENIDKPFVITLRSAGKLKKMKVVKFNSF